MVSAFLLSAAIVSQNAGAADPPKPPKPSKGLFSAIFGARTAARRTQSSNNLKQLGLSMHNYYDVHQALPAQYRVTEQNKPLLSWRVFVLPYIDASAVYEQFRLNEPWDSEHNKQLLPMMPQVYLSPQSKNKRQDGKTNYLATGGEGSVWRTPAAPGAAQKSPVGVRFRSVTDGLSNTIMVMEVNDAHAVEWTKPADITIDPKAPFAAAANTWDTGYLVLFCDGAVRILPKDTDAATGVKLITMSGGERVDVR